ncbi:7148_t:CDS:2 [Funneliformis mosseae]|uniref:7148_t:CDS:1 n=1 Tax=Funneliformis mosseae TaxID=27381 RepID=A0A9N8V3D6_FUNMO|nr:7148_t:CDS:2 [Funneliformis mosseae]
MAFMLGDIKMNLSATKLVHLFATCMNKGGVVTQVKLEDQLRLWHLTFIEFHVANCYAPSSCSNISGILPDLNIQLLESPFQNSKITPTHIIEPNQLLESATSDFWRCWVRYNLMSMGVVLASQIWSHRERFKIRRCLRYLRLINLVRISSHRLINVLNATDSKFDKHSYKHIYMKKDKSQFETVLEHAIRIEN